MINGTVNNSHFFKADRREALVSDSAGFYFTSGELISVEDIFLMPSKTCTIRPERQPYLLLPLVGTVLVTHKNVMTMVYAEELRIISDGDVKVTNPYDHKTINLLKIDLHTSQPFYSHNGLLPLNAKNCQSEALGIECKISVGVYDARTKGNYKVSPGKNGIYAFVINGSFEIEERLAEHRDGLSLTGVSGIAFEALSENAILLLIEF